MQFDYPPIPKIWDNIYIEKIDQFSPWLGNFMQNLYNRLS